MNKFLYCLAWSIIALVVIFTVGVFITFIPVVFFYLLSFVLIIGVVLWAWWYIDEYNWRKNLDKF